VPIGHIPAARTFFRRLSVGDDDDFDPDKFHARYRDILATTDPFTQAVLNAHLDVEAHLGEFLEQLVFHPADLEKVQLDTGTKSISRARSSSSVVTSRIGG
jgi:hypothetical protein